MTRGATPKDNRPGKDLEYFRLDRAAAEVAALWYEVIGREPKAISGLLPYPDPAECLSIWDELWDGKNLIWRGDGERLHVQKNGLSYVRYAPGEGPAQPAAAGERVGKGKVTRNSRLRLLLPQLRIAGIFEVMSSSAIDADELWSNLMWIKATVATLQGAPVTVFRAARQFNIPNPKGEGTMAVTKHMLHLMLDGRYLDAIMPPPTAPLLLTVTPDQAAAIGDEAPDVDDGDYEDAPPAVAKTPAPATKGSGGRDAGPLPDDEVIINETPAGGFITATAALLDEDDEAVKARLHDLGYNRIPGKPADRLTLYRRLRDERPEEATQPALVETAPEVTPGSEYRED
jgi:hypothetical protein